MRLLILTLLFTTQLFSTFSYMSPGISIGKNNHDGLFISAQISLGISFRDDHINDSPDKFYDYLVPSVSIGIKYFPDLPIKKDFWKSKKLVTYADFQTTIWSNIGIIGYGIGFNKNKGDDSFRMKTKAYLGYMLLYNYEKEKNSDYVDKSMMLVIPLPMKEWIPTGDDWQEDSTSEP